MLAIFEKYFTWQFPELKELKPEPFEKFVMDHDYFSCYLPVHWKLGRNKAEDEADGIFAIYLTMPDKAQSEDGEADFLPDPLIYAGYYGPNNRQQKTYESYLKEYVETVLKKEGSAQARYERPQEIDFNGKKATELTYEVYLTIPRTSAAPVKYWLKARFIVLKAKEGFYVLAYKSPTKFYAKYLPVFEEVAKTFQTGY